MKYHKCHFYGNCNGNYIYAYISAMMTNTIQLFVPKRFCDELNCSLKIYREINILYFGTVNQFE